MTTKSSLMENNLDHLPPPIPAQSWLIMVLVVLAGILFALNLMPLWLPALTFSAAGSEPKVFWFLARGSAMAGYWILWLSMAMGIIITNKLAQVWPGIPPAYEIHQYTSLLGLGFALFHALILTGDQYIKYTVLNVFVPFSGQGYRPIWVGIGQLAFYVWAVVTFSFYVRKRIGKKAWRLIHFASYASFLGVMLHAIFSGTDSAAPWVGYLYWFSAGSLLFLTVYRILIEVFSAANERQRNTAA